MDDDTTTPTAARTEADWRDILTPGGVPRAARGRNGEALLRGVRERPHDQRVYACRACGAELFRSETKFDAACGWPSFYAPLAEDRVRYIKDTTMGMERVEVRCATCESHMGHVFGGEGFATPTDLRYCMNSLSLRLVADTAE